jgi:16S rRNA (cytosine967-C5)-methyltransferase
MRSYSYLNSVGAVIKNYDGSLPLSVWLKNYFKENKKFGSKDRKQVAHICFCFYRLGNSFSYLDIEEKMLLALFLCSGESNFVLKELKPEWNENIFLPLERKIEMLGVKESVNEIFSLKNELSEEIEFEAFSQSFLIQPELFLRIRPDKKEKILQSLQEGLVQFDLIKENCIRLNNGTKVEELIEIDKDAVVQDMNSQQVLNFPQLQTINFKLQTSVWDCCAASGGKSILFHDFFPEAVLTVSDIRESILNNLKKRFLAAGIKTYNSYLLDLTSQRFSFTKKFDIIICDAPCSGSGTWSRTPEQLSFFKKEKIDYYADLQKKIAMNAAKSLKDGGYFIYITCSVFTKENEEMVKFITSNSALQLLSMQYLKGYDKKADTLFAALFQL